MRILKTLGQGALTVLLVLAMVGCGLFGSDPEPITGVKAVANSVDFVTVSWDAMEDAGEYTVFVSESASESGRESIGSTSGTTMEYSEGTPGTTYYFHVEYKLSGESYYADVPSFEFASAVFPEPSPGVDTVSLSLPTGLPTSTAWNGVEVTWDLKGDATAVSKFQVYLRYEGQSEFFKFNAGGTIGDGPIDETYTYLTKNDDGSFTLTYNLGITYTDDDDVTYNKDGRTISVKVEALDAGGEVLNAVTESETMELFDRIRALGSSKSGDTLTLAFTAPSLAEWFKITSDNSNEALEYRRSDLSTATMAEIGNPSITYENIYKVSFTLTDWPSGWSTFTVTPGKTSSSYDSNASGIRQVLW